MPIRFSALFVSALFGFFFLKIVLSLAAAHADPGNQNGESYDRNTYTLLEQSRELLPAYPDSAIASLEYHQDPEWHYSLSDSILGKTHYVLGLAYYFKQYYRVAVYHNLQALEYLDPSENNRTLRAVWNNLGIYYDLLEMWDESLHAYEQAMELVAARQDTIGVAQVKLNLGLISKNLGLYDSALRYTELALDTFEAVNDSYHSGLALMNRALIHIETGNLDLAESSLLDARSLFGETDEFHMKSRALNNLAYLYFDHADAYDDALSLARRYIFESKNILTEHSPAPSLIYQNIMAMTVEIADGNYDQAREYFEYVTEHPGLSQLSSRYLTIVLQGGSQLFALSGDLDGMKALIDRINSIQSDRSGDKAQQAIAENEVINKVSNLQGTIALQEDQIAAERAKLVIVSVASMLLLAMLIVILFFKKELDNTRVMYLTKAMLYKNNRIKPEFEGFSEFKHASRDDYFRKVCHLLESEHIYMNNDVKLEQLAKRLGTNTKYISRAINQNTGLNFNKFINLYRVNKARELIDKYQNKISYIDIAEKSGFRNETTFYRNFKELTKMTPREYQQRQLRSFSKNTRHGDRTSEQGSALESEDTSAI